MFYWAQHCSVQVVSHLDTLKYYSILALKETSKVSLGWEANYPIHAEKKMAVTIIYLVGKSIQVFFLLLVSVRKWSHFHSSWISTDYLTDKYKICFYWPNLHLTPMSLQTAIQNKHRNRFKGLFIAADILTWHNRPEFKGVNSENK